MASEAETFDYEAARAEFKLEIPDDFNFAFDVLATQAGKADKTALIAVANDGESAEEQSYGDLERASNQFANVLKDIGAEKGDFAFVMITRIPAFYHALFGCMKMGVVAMPGTNLLTAHDIEYRVNRSGAKIVIVTAEHAEKVEAVRDQCPTLEHLIIIGEERAGWTCKESACATAPDTFDRSLVPPTKASDLMLIYFTSGTTSLPKMVARDHAYGLAHTITCNYWQGLRRDDIHWTLTDTGWAKAAWGIIFPPIIAGAAIMLYDAAGFDADMHLKLIEKYKVTTFCAPPTVYRLFATMDISPYDVSSIRHCIGAGEPLNPEAMRSWKAATGCDIHDGYGQTETVNIVANYPGMEIRPGSMGKPVPGIDIGIIDDDGNVVADDIVGHIAVKITDPYPPGLFDGYFRDPEATAKSFRNGWYYTGDTATRDGDGYIWFVGRSDDIISSSGYRISPFEVESALVEHPGVMESAVVAKADEMRGEIVKAFVVLSEGYEASDDLVVEIQDFVKNLTAPYKYPREIEFREALPKTISGKIRRVELRAEADG
ncbi:MAG: AMP-binding protein [Alphaproteobacteria bacterium]|nr:AMP-binding protein [Alphaproteobacteria bacterium]MDP6253389.1 AMP-binding protein [Alphaproteobacteria bacterium]MDP7055481.1 AMP-binding protein [Alphaproteobacteria bacterium]MDP7227992.1 AMP-binding protein [Alphaproteobacteria bacterium]MDP7461675.1 AMP-binding protein [Alphaproteobacteria bacterium]